jgi:hypothetical protein
MKARELKDVVLDYMVGKCEGHLYAKETNNPILFKWEERIIPHYSTCWEVGGPIIERQKIAIWHEDSKIGGDFVATAHVCINVRDQDLDACTIAAWNEDDDTYRGDTPLVAAMRCYVATKLGDEINIPKELL